MWIRYPGIQLNECFCVRQLLSKLVTHLGYLRRCVLSGLLILREEHHVLPGGVHHPSPNEGDGRKSPLLSNTVVTCSNFVFTTSKSLESCVDDFDIVHIVLHDLPHLLSGEVHTILLAVIRTPGEEHGVGEGEFKVVSDPRVNSK